MPEQLILLIDDHRMPMVFYVQALERAGFVVEHCFDPDSAIAVANARAEEVGAIILDIMMPAGKQYADKDTDDGLRTGVLLYQDLVKICPDVPLIILTNVSDEAVLASLPRRDNMRVVAKLNATPQQLTSQVLEMLRDRTSGN